ncbi:MAG: VTT domain-containing protein [Oscillospiraceae bacterium]|nr:VTT domain-containing protein [Oscillospiraceae bacterium]
MKKHNIATVISMAALFCLLIVMVVQLFPLIRDMLTHGEDESSIVAYVNSIGWRGVPALIGLSALQAIIIIIPAPAVGVLTGLSYGIYWGPLIFLSGVALGNLFVVVTVRQLHSLIPPRTKQTVKHNKLLSKERLKKIRRPELVAFFLAMIPWLSSAGPYLFAETRVSLGKYMIAVVVGNIPSALIYVFLGDRISRGNYMAAIIIAGIVVIAAVFILVFRKKIMEKIMVESDV